MFSMFKQLFAAFTVLFSSVEKISKALDNLATIGEEMSEGYLAETRLERQARLAELQKQLKLTK